MAEGRLPKTTLNLMPKQKSARGKPKKNWTEDIRKAMDERNLNKGQWEDRKQWSLGVGQRRKTFWNRYIYIYIYITNRYIYIYIYIYIYYQQCRFQPRWLFRKWDVGVWTGSIWLRIGTGGGHLGLRQYTFGFHKMRGISWLAENLLASQEGLCSAEWVSE